MARLKANKIAPKKVYKFLVYVGTSEVDVMAESYDEVGYNQDFLELYLNGNSVATFRTWDYVVRAHEIKLDNPTSSSES